MLTLLTFLVVFSVLVLFHELGHFLFAKAFRMRVEEFSLGMFEPHLRLFTLGETDYTVRAWPLGGFVRIAGMEIKDESDDAADDRHSSIDNTNTHAMKQESAEVDQADPDGFNSRPIYQRFLVMLAGPAFSLLLGFLAFSLMAKLYGVQDGPFTTRIAIVTPGSPAQSVGLKPGDTILSVDGKRVADGDAMIAAIHASNGHLLHLVIQPAGAAGTTRDIAVTPHMDMVDGKPTPRIGVSPDVNRRPVSIGEAFASGGRDVALFFTLLGKLIETHQIAGAIGGPVAIADDVGQAREAGADAVLALIAQLSLSVGVCNLLPIPVLDGGHLVLLGLEGIRRRKLTAAQTQGVLMTGVAVLAVVFVVVTVKDLSAKYVAAHATASATSGTPAGATPPANPLPSARPAGIVLPSAAPH
jgi:regulator of sigma E protease